jgi:hypothetical protein
MVVSLGSAVYSCRTSSSSPSPLSGSPFRHGWMKIGPAAPFPPFVERPVRHLSPIRTRPKDQHGKRDGKQGLAGPSLDSTGR